VNYPEEIEGSVLEIAATVEQIKRRRSAIRAIEIDIAAEATTAKGPDGKLLLTNETQRKAAIEKMVAESEEYSTIADELGNLEQDKVKLEARLERQRMEWRSHLQDREEQVYQAAIRAADAIRQVRQDYPIPHHVEAEIELPF
jgi:hypothetical protein